MTHDQLQALCFVWFHNTFPEQRGRCYMNLNNAKNARQGAVLKGMGLVAGVADMTYLASDGKVDYIEFKVGRDRQSKAQKDFQAQAEALGHRYHIVRTVAQFQAIIKKAHGRYAGI